ERRAAAGLRYDATLAESGRALLSLQFARLRSFDGALRNAPSMDDIHDARVAARRLRTLLRLFRRAYPRRDLRSLDGGLKRLGDALGDVRDLDVLQQAVARAAEQLPHREGIAALLDHWQQEQRQLHGELATLMEGAEHRDWLAEMQRFLAATSTSERGRERLCERGPALLWRRYGAVRAGARDLDGASLEELHELRKEVRRLRYLLEGLRELLGGAGEDAIAAAVEVQDALGALHDADVLRGLLHDWLERAKGDSAIDLATEQAGVIALHERTRAEIVALRRAFDETWPHVGGRRFRRHLGRTAAAL
ncbi:MAG TPA: CHAD domain-containing protein, partial [Dehalococcoidia bacterium]